MQNLKTVVGLNLAAFLMMLGVGMIMALLPQRIIMLTGSGGTVGYLASAFAVSYIILQVPIGNFSDKLGFKFFIFAGYLICSVTGFIYYFANHPHLYFWGRILQGAGEAPVWALAPALLSIRYPASKGKVIGIYNASIHTGLTIGPLLGILLSDDLTGNQPFLFYAGVCLAGALLVLCSVVKAKNDAFGEKTTFQLKNMIQLATDRNSCAVLLGITLYGAGYGIFLTVIPSFLIISKNFSQTSVSVFFALFYIAISLSQLMTGVLSDKMGRKFFLVAGLVTASLGIAAFPLFNQPFIGVALFIGSLGLGVFYLASLAFLNEVVPDSLKGTISGAYYLFWGIGFFCGPMIIGKICETGAVAGYQILAISLMIEACVLLFNKGSGMKGSRIHSRY